MAAKIFQVKDKKTSKKINEFFKILLWLMHKAKCRLLSQMPFELLKTPKPKKDHTSLPCNITRKD